MSSPLNRSKDLYEVLGLEKGADQDDIKRAYRKVSFFPPLISSWKIFSWKIFFLTLQPMAYDSIMIVNMFGMLWHALHKWCPIQCM